MQQLYTVVLHLKVFSLLFFVVFFVYFFRVYLLTVCAL